MGKMKTILTGGVGQSLNKVGIIPSVTDFEPIFSPKDTPIGKSPSSFSGAVGSSIIKKPKNLKRKSTVLKPSTSLLSSNESASKPLSNKLG